MDRDILTLKALNTALKRSLEQAFPQHLWVTAEILEMHLNRSGHCYLELVEKSEKGEQIEARAKGTIWASKYPMLRSYFETTTGARLEAGIKVLVKCEISFHSLYGLSLNIRDIDPTYTLGDLELKRKQILLQLTEEGVIDMNRDLELPAVPQRLAVISSESAAGYGDFVDSLLHNQHGFSFAVSLYPAVMQGEATVNSVIGALDSIHTQMDEFDAVVIIRGGGSQSDLEAFNDYELAVNIAQFPLPVVTGIGHERDHTIADEVAHLSLKTPTAVAEFFIDKLLLFLGRIQEQEERLTQVVQWIVNREKMLLQQRSSEIRHLSKEYLSEAGHHLSQSAESMRHLSWQILERGKSGLQNLGRMLEHGIKRSISEQHRSLELTADRLKRESMAQLQERGQALQLQERTLELVDPVNVLARGYSITYRDGQVIKESNQVKPGDQLEITLYKGSIDTTVNKSN